MGLIIIGILAVVVLIIVFYVISAYNRLVSEQLKVDNQWSQIDIVMKQRNDTLPNLMNVVSGYATHEKELFEEVSNARMRYTNASDTDESVQAASELSGCISRLFAIAENYPELKANANFMDLQNKISSLEEKIADFRQFYNDTVMRYNRLILMFPSNMIARMLGFKERKFFEVDESDKKIPEVKF